MSISPVRCCDTCDKFINMQLMNSNELSNMSPKALKEYITAYNLPFKTAIEKDDLVRIIFNTRPISNENEKHYRNKRTRASNGNHNPSSTPPPTQNNEDSRPFSFTNMMQDLFTPPSIPSSPSPNNTRAQEQLQRENQRRHQEQVRIHQQRQQDLQRQHQEEARRQHELARARQEEITRRAREQAQRRSTPSPSTQNTNTNNTTQNTPRSRSSPPLSNDNLLSLHDLVKAKIDPASLSVRTLKSILKANFVEQSHVIEKSELVKLVIRLADQHRADEESSKKNDDEGGGNEDNLCRICFDNQQNCVFLDCGHMVTCMECAKKVSEKTDDNMIFFDTDF